MDWNITATDFLAVYETDRDEMIVLDVREIEEYEAYHLPGSTLIPMDEIYCRIKEVNRTMPIYVICEHGIRSIHATMILYDLGYKQVYNVMGGFEKIMNYDLLRT